MIALLPELVSVGGRRTLNNSRLLFSGVLGIFPLSFFRLFDNADARRQKKSPGAACKCSFLFTF